MTNSMRNIWTVARRDFRAYFTSPIAYIVIAGFLFIMGYMFTSILDFFIKNMQYQQFGQGAKGLTLTRGIVQPLYTNMNVIFLFLVPFITMKLFAEEKKQHTLELLMTSPISLTEIVLGKFLSALLLIKVMLGLTLIYPIVLMLTGTPEIGPIFTYYIGLLLICGCYLAIGILFSAVTENQIVAGTLTFAGALFLWILNWATQTAGPVWGEILGYLSLISHFNSFGQGMINTNDVFYFLSFIGVGLFLTHRVLDSYRWR